MVYEIIKGMLWPLMKEEKAESVVVFRQCNNTGHLTVACYMHNMHCMTLHILKVNYTYDIFVFAL